MRDDSDALLTASRCVDRPDHLPGADTHEDPHSFVPGEGFVASPRPFDADENSELPELRADIMRVLLDFVVSSARAEQEAQRFAEEIRNAELQMEQTKRSANLASVAALLAAAFAAAATVFSATHG